MAKKKVAKKATKKESSKKTDELLVQNFIALQKVMTTMSVKFEMLSEQITKLLSLFEVSAKSLAEKQGFSMDKEDKDFLEKLDKLIEQNKLIAKGLTIMDERLKKEHQEKPNPESIRPLPKQ